jgi:hypothetical protein
MLPPLIVFHTFTGTSKSFGASSLAEGLTVTNGSSSRPGASNTRGFATTSAGEKALRQLPRNLIRDGGSGQANVQQQALGKKPGWDPSLKGMLANQVDFILQATRCQLGCVLPV